MKHTLIGVAFCLLFASFAFGQSISKPSDLLGPAPEISIIPMPIAIIRDVGKFSLDSKTIIIAKDPAAKALAAMLNDELQRRVGFMLKVTSKQTKVAAIIFDPASDGADGWYSLQVDSNKIKIGGSLTGRFYALQSLYQMMSPTGKNKIEIQRAAISDVPRFKYRGMHLDVSRHFFPVDFVKKYIDLLAQYKFNYFHWHLTDDQGWRIEIKKYPRLTEVGSKRTETHVGNYSPIFKGDGVPVEGYYTQEQIRDVVAYAKARYITVIPEIELPGHASAALAAYPQFGCKADHKYEVKKTWGIFKEVFCPTDETFKFLEDVIDETLALFPDSPYIHIGGDEVLKDHWKESSFVQELKKKEGLKDEHEVQSYFVQRIEKHVNSRGKKIIGWDEILEGGLAPNATVMSWRGMKGGIEAAKAKHDVIMTPTDYCYLDYGQGDPATEPINIGGWLPLEKVYQFDPVPKGMAPEDAKFIIGGQGNIWAEYLKRPENVEYMALPRMLAIAESVWSPPENKNFADFQRRLNGQLARLDKQNVNYRIPPPPGLENKILGQNESTVLDLSTPIPGARVFYTIDGSDPTERSILFTKPFEIDPAEKARVDVKAIVVLANGRKSSVYTATVLRGLFLGPLPDPKVSTPGAVYNFVVPPGPDSIEPTVTTGETKSVGLAQFAKIADLSKPFGVTFDGYVNFPADAIYEFQVDSTWDTTILIDGVRVIDDSGTSERKTRSELIALGVGRHRVSLRYNHRGGEAFWRVRWAIKGQNWRGMELVQ